MTSPFTDPLVCAFCKAKIPHVVLRDHLLIVHGYSGLQLPEQNKECDGRFEKHQRVAQCETCGITEALKETTTEPKPEPAKCEMPLPHYECKSPSAPEKCGCDCHKVPLSFKHYCCGQAAWFAPPSAPEDEIEKLSEKILGYWAFSRSDYDKMRTQIRALVAIVFREAAKIAGNCNETHSCEGAFVANLIRARAERFEK